MCEAFTFFVAPSRRRLFPVAAVVVFLLTPLVTVPVGGMSIVMSYGWPDNGGSHGCQTNSDFNGNSACASGTTQLSNGFDYTVSHCVSTNAQGTLCTVASGDAFAGWYRYNHATNTCEERSVLSSCSCPSGYKTISAVLVRSGNKNTNVLNFCAKAGGMYMRGSPSTPNPHASNSLGCPSGWHAQEIEMNRGQYGTGTLGICGARNCDTDSAGCSHCDSNDMCTICTSTYYLSGATCAEKLSDGYSCTTHGSCKQNNCRGNRCCRSNVGAACTTCTTNGQCTACSGNNFVSGGICHAKRSDGNVCSFDTWCLSGHCHARCCKTSVGTLCAACDGTGSCTACSGDHFVSTGGACEARRADGVSCDGNKDDMCTNRKCRGTCCRTTVGAPCAACNASGLCTACSGNNFVNDAGNCETQRNDGDTCGTDLWCLSGHCHGSCCNAAADGLCNACNATGGCAACSGSNYVNPGGSCEAKRGDGNVCNFDTWCLSSHCHAQCCKSSVDSLCSMCDTAGSCTACTGDHFVSTGGACEARRADGVSCDGNKDDMCTNRKCRGRCCRTTVGPPCTACNADGACTACSSNNFVNDAGNCEAQRSDGVACARDAMCLSGTCRSGACCDVNVNSTTCLACDTRGWCRLCLEGWHLRGVSCISSITASPTESKSTSASLSLSMSNSPSPTESLTWSLSTTPSASPSTTATLTPSMSLSMSMSSSSSPTESLTRSLPPTPSVSLSTTATPSPSVSLPLTPSSSLTTSLSLPKTPTISATITPPVTPTGDPTRTRTFSPTSSNSTSGSTSSTGSISPFSCVVERVWHSHPVSVARVMRGTRRAWLNFTVRVRPILDVENRFNESEFDVMSDSGTWNAYDYQRARKAITVSWGEVFNVATRPPNHIDVELGFPEGGSDEFEEAMSLPLYSSTDVDLTLDLRRQSQLFQCSHTPTVVGTPATLDEIPPPVPARVRDGIGVLATSTALVGGMVANPTLVMVPPRVNSLSKLTACEVAHDEPISRVINPLNWHFGRPRAAYYRGAIAGNAFLLLALAGLVAIPTLVMYDPRIPMRNLWGSMGVIHLPGILIVPIALFLGSSAEVATSLVIAGRDPLDPTVAGMAYVTLVVIIVGCLLPTTKFLGATTVARDVDGESPSTASFRAGPLLDRIKSFLIWIFFSDIQWVDLEGHKGFKTHWMHLFVDYKEGKTWYFAAEMIVTALVGMVSGGASHESCGELLYVMLVVLFAHAVSTVVVRPMVTLFDTVFHITTSVLTFVSALLGAIASSTDNELLIRASVSLSLAVSLLSTIKVCLDITMLLRTVYRNYLAKLLKRKNKRAHAGSQVGLLARQEAFADELSLNPDLDRRESHYVGSLAELDRVLDEDSEGSEEDHLLQSDETTENCLFAPSATGEEEEDSLLGEPMAEEEYHEDDGLLDGPEEDACGEGSLLEYPDDDDVIGEEDGSSFLGEPEEYGEDEEQPYDEDEEWGDALEEEQEQDAEEKSLLGEPAAAQDDAFVDQQVQDDDDEVSLDSVLNEIVIDEDVEDFPAPEAPHYGGGYANGGFFNDEDDAIGHGFLDIPEHDQGLLALPSRQRGLSGARKSGQSLQLHDELKAMLTSASRRRSNAMVRANTTTNNGCIHGPTFSASASVQINISCTFESEADPI